MAKKQFKALRGSTRAIDKSIALGDKTKDRVKGALDKLAGNAYGTTDLADDLVAQTSDFVTTLTGILSGASDDDVATLYLITNGPGPKGTVSLKTVATGQQIEKSILQGPITATGNNAGNQVVTIHNIAANDYNLLHPDTGAALQNIDEVDSVTVEIPTANVPGQAGIYRGVLTLQNTDVLAEIVFVKK